MHARVAFVYACLCSYLFDICIVCCGLARLHAKRCLDDIGTTSRIHWPGMMANLHLASRHDGLIRKALLAIY